MLGVLSEKILRRCHDFDFFARGKRKVFVNFDVQDVLHSYLVVVAPVIRTPVQTPEEQHAENKVSSGSGTLNNVLPTVPDAPP